MLHMCNCPTVNIWRTTSEEANNWIWTLYLAFEPFGKKLDFFCGYISIIPGHFAREKQIMVSLLLSHNAHFFFLFGLGWRGRGGVGGGEGGVGGVSGLLIVSLFQL